MQCGSQRMAQMSPSKVDLAVLNSMRWHETVFEAHGLAGPHMTQGELTATEHLS
jgi:hypothetical protein